jgi:hypothetical protein
MPATSQHIGRGAIMSADERYRLVLWRRWDADRAPLGFVLLNPPPAADDDEDDATLRRCMGFARRDGFGGIIVATLFDLPATYQVELINHPDPVGPDRDPWPKLAPCGMVVAAWGDVHKYLRWRIDQVLALRPATTPLWALGRTAAGDPLLPLRSRNDTPLRPWTPPERGRP